MTITGAACGWPLVRVRRQSDHVGEAQRPSPILGRTGGPFLGAVGGTRGHGRYGLRSRSNGGCGLVTGCPCGGWSGCVGSRPAGERCVASAGCGHGGPLRQLSGDACAAAGVVSVAPGRCGRGDRRRVAGEGRRGRASADRGAVGPAGVDGAGLVARLRRATRRRFVRCSRRCWCSWIRWPGPLPASRACSPMRWRRSAACAGGGPPPARGGGRGVAVAAGIGGHRPVRCSLPG